MAVSSLEKLYKHIEGFADEAVRLQKILTAVPALAPENGGEGEWSKAQTVKMLLEDAGFDEWTDLHAPDNRVPAGFRPNTVVRLKGRRPRRTVWIMSHLDIVPPGDLSQWENDPYQTVYRDGRVIGRGVEDNQQALVSSLLAVKALKETGIAPENNAGLVIVSDEETGSRFGIDHVLNVRPDLFRKTDWIVIPDAGDADGKVIETAEKSVLWLQFDILGKQTHGSTPEKGANAHRAGAHLIVGLDRLHRLFPGKNPLFDPPVSTFEPTKKEANVPNINTVPGSDRFCFDCRVLPDVPLNALLARIRSAADRIEKRFNVQVRIECVHRIQAPAPTSARSPVVAALKSAVKDCLGRKAHTLGIGGGTVAASFRARGLPAVCWTCIDDTAHAPNEYSKISNTLNDAKVFAHLFMQK